MESENVSINICTSYEDSSSLHQIPVEKNEKRVINRSDKFEKNRTVTQKQSHGKPNVTAFNAPSKFSSLFKNNPDVKVVDQKPVQLLSEQLFTDEKFSSTSLHPHMIANLLQLGFENMTSVQKESLPKILDGNDVLIKSQTGSGKTLAYSVPLIESLQKIDPPISRCDGPYAIIILPTRELAMQTYNTYLQLVKPFQRIVPGYITGGEKKKSEKARIRKGINVLISTPGRLLDHMCSTATLTLNRVRYLAIDEADRLLELGFEKDIAKIISLINERGPVERQTILLSATLSSAVDKLSSISLKNPINIDICHKKGESNTKSIECDTDNFSLPTNLQHHYIVLPYKLRLVTLAAFILWKCKFSSKRNKMVVFISTQDSVEFHYNVFKNNLCGNSEKNELQFFKLHGDMIQKERSTVFEEFCKNDCGILFCTDVAARGLDMPYVRWIVQYNVPGAPADYIHRVGRTARIGGKGHGLIFLQPSEVEYLNILNDNNISLQEIKLATVLPSLLLSDGTSVPPNSLDHYVKEKATSMQKLFESFILENKDRRSMARKAYGSFIRSYCTFPSSVKHIFNVKSLHLGHVAKSFALQDCPTTIGGIVAKFKKMDGKNTFRKSKNREFSATRGAFNRKRPLSVNSTNEFSSGLQSRKKQKIL